MRIAITGSSGFIGTAVAAWFRNLGHTVIPVTRQGDHLHLDPLNLSNLDVVINLAGASIVAQRWTSAYKKILYDSRVKNTVALCRFLAVLDKPPHLLLSASAIGFYGNIEPPDTVNEDSNVGNMFLSYLCKGWERSTEEAQAAGIRVVHTRFGLVLGPQGGVLGKILPIFRCGLGGRLGSGKQIMSWIALDEIPLVMEHVMKTLGLSGPVNFVAPGAVSNAHFTRLLAGHLHRPAFFAVPSTAIEIFLGEMGRELLLSGAKVGPQRLMESGYTFRYPDLTTAFSAMLPR